MYNANIDFEQFQTFQRQQWENFQSFQKQQWDQFNQFTSSRSHRDSSPVHAQGGSPVRSHPPQIYLPHYVQQSQPQQPQSHFSHPAQQASFHYPEEDQYFSPILNRFREPQQFEEQHPLRWLYNLFENHTQPPQAARRPRRVFVARPEHFQTEEEQEKDEPIVEEAFDEAEVEEQGKQEEENSQSDQAANRWVEFLKYLHNKHQQEANRRKEASENNVRRAENVQQQAQPSPQQRRPEEAPTGTNPFDFLGNIFQGFKKQGQTQEQASAQAQSAKNEAPRAQPVKRDSQIPVKPAEKPLTTQERLDKIAAEFEGIKSNLSNSKPKATESKLMTLLTQIDDIHCEDEKQKSFRHKLAAEINRTIEALLESEASNSSLKSESAPKVESKSEEAAAEVKSEASEVPQESKEPSETVHIPVATSESEQSIPVSEADNHVNIPVSGSGAPPAKVEVTPAETLDKIAAEYNEIAASIESKSLTDRKSIKATENKLNKLLVTLDEFQCSADLRPRKKELVKNINNAIELLFNIDAPSPAPSPAVQPAQEQPVAVPESASEPSAPEQPQESPAESVSEPAPEPVQASAPSVVEEPKQEASEQESMKAEATEQVSESAQVNEEAFAPESNEQAAEISSTNAPVEEAPSTSVSDAANESVAPASSETNTEQTTEPSVPIPVVDDILIESVPVGAD